MATKKPETITGRSWKCPKCNYVIKEAAVHHSAVTCNRTQSCRNKGHGTSMVLVEAKK